MLPRPTDSTLCWFGDGIETDTLKLTWGQRLTITSARQHLNLVVA